MSKVAWLRSGPCLLALAVLAFLAPGIAHLRDGYFSSADFTQHYTLTQLDAGYEPGNSLESDPPTQFLPWLIQARRELAQGRLPLWSDSNGCGAPLLANYQSGLLSPFHWPYLLLPLALALLVSAFLKLYLAGLGTWALLRARGLGDLPSALGGLAFAFCGHNALLVHLPHSAVAACLPWMLLGVERSAQRLLDPAALAAVARSGRAAAPALLGTALALLVGALAGQPETFAFCALLTAAYALARGLRAWLRPRAGAPLARVAAFGGALLVAAALAAGLAAPQWLPFFEYLQASSALAERSSGPQTPLPPEIWPLVFAPKALGYPARGVLLSYQLPPPDYQIANMSNCGFAALALALVGLAQLRGQRFALFCALVALAWVPYAHGWFGIDALVGALPGLSTAPINRSQLVFTLAVALLAAHGFEFLLERASASARACALRAAAGLALLAGGLAWAWFSAHAHAAGRVGEQPFLHALRGHLLDVGLLGALFAGAAAVLPLARARPWARALALALVALVAFEHAWQWRRYTPITPAERFYPRTPAIETLSQAVGAQRLAVLGGDTLPPCTNAVYGLALPTHYDALGLAKYDELYRQCFGSGGNWRPTLRATVGALRLFSIGFVLAKHDWLPIDSGMQRAAWAPGGLPPVEIPLEPGRRVAQGLRSARAGLSSVAVWLGADPALAGGDARLRLFALPRRELVAERAIAGAEVCGPGTGIATESDPPLRTPGRWFALAFAPQLDSAGMSYELELDSGDSRGLSVWRTVRRSAGARGALGIDGRASEGALIFDFAYDGEQFERVAELGAHSLWRLRDALPRAYTVDRAVLVENAVLAGRVLLAPSFDPARACVLESGAELRGLAPTQLRADHELPPVPLDRPQWLVDEPGRVLLRCARAQPGFLVLCDAWAPGWSARLDGEPVPVLRANHAFRAVELPAGEHELEFVYAPLGWRLGLWIAAASALLAAGLFALLRWRA